jgi:integrase
MTARRGAGEGAVFQRSDGYWVGRVELGRSSTGRRLRGQVVRRTKQSVLNGLRELQRQAEAGVAPDKTRTVTQYLHWWLENVAPETVSPDTLVDYRWQLEHYVIPHVGRMRLAKLTPADVQKMLRSLEKAGYSPRTRQYARAILRRERCRGQRERAAWSCATPPPWWTARRRPSPSSTTRSAPRRRRRCSRRPGATGSKR